MREVMINQKNNQKLIVLSLKVLFIFLTFLYLLYFDDYYDDWNFFYTVDANVSNEETWQRHYYGDRGGWVLKEAYPWVFTYFTKYILKFIGYSVENTHYFLLFFSILSIFTFYKLSNLISKDFSFRFTALILFALNLFLIRELNAFRPHSPTLLLSLISNYYFIKVFIKNINTYRNYTFYFISTLTMLTIWPQSLAIFAGQGFFLLIFFVNFKRIIILASIFFVYILLNLDYLFYLTGNFDGYTPFEKKFFINYFFRTFFGSVFFGGYMLILFTYYLLKKINLIFLKNKFKDFKENEMTVINYFLVLIITVYSLLIIYSQISSSVMTGKYFIPLIPMIIFWVSYNLHQHSNKLLKNITLLLALINCIYFWNDIPIDRPPMRDALKIINSENKNIKKIFTNEQTTFNHFLQNYNFSKKNGFEVKNIKYYPQSLKKEVFAILCLNNARFMYGNNEDMSDSKICLDIYKKKNFKLLKTTKIPDFIIYFIENENNSINLLE